MTCRAYIDVAFSSHTLYGVVRTPGANVRRGCTLASSTMFASTSVACQKKNQSPRKWNPNGGSSITGAKRRSSFDGRSFFPSVQEGIWSGYSAKVHARSARGSRWTTADPAAIHVTVTPLVPSLGLNLRSAKEVVAVKEKQKIAKYAHLVEDKQLNFIPPAFTFYRLNFLFFYCSVLLFKPSGLRLAPPSTGGMQGPEKTFSV